MTKIKIELNGWWGDESVLLKPESTLYKLKMNFIEELMKRKIITEGDMDNRNKTPHIRITNKSKKKSEAAYNKINNSEITIDVDGLNISRNFAEISTGDSYELMQTHMTMIFKRDVDKHKTEMMEIFAELLKTLA